MYFGWPSLCLSVRDLDDSASFYEALGMEVLHDLSSEGKRVILRSGGFHLGLFVDIRSNCVNFRGADVFAAHDMLKERFPNLVGQPESYLSSEVNGADAAGTCWLTRDPDQNEIFFDTNETEEGEAYKRARIGQILSGAEHELASVGATECLDVLRRELIERFCAPG